MDQPIPNIRELDVHLRSVCPSKHKHIHLYTSDFLSAINGCHCRLQYDKHHHHTLVHNLYSKCHAIFQTSQQRTHYNHVLFVSLLYYKWRYFDLNRSNLSLLHYLVDGSWYTQYTQRFRISQEFIRTPQRKSGAWNHSTQPFSHSLRYTY